MSISLKMSSLHASWAKFVLAMRGRCQHTTQSRGSGLQAAHMRAWLAGRNQRRCLQGWPVCWPSTTLLHGGTAAACAHLVLSLSPGSTPAGGRVMIFTAYWSPVLRSVASLTMAKPAGMCVQGVWGGYGCVRCVQEPSAATTQS